MANDQVLAQTSPVSKGLGTDLNMTPGQMLSELPSYDTAKLLEIQAKSIPLAAQANAAATEAQMTFEANKKLESDKAAARVSEQFLDQQDKLSKDLLDAPTFKFDQEHAMLMGNIASILSMVGIAMGGRGKLGALGAIDSMTGMVSGLQKGDEAAYKRAKDQYDEYSKSIDQHNKIIQRKMDDAIKLYPIDRDRAMREAEDAAIISGQESVIGKMILNGQWIAVNQMTEKLIAAKEKADETARRIQKEKDDLDERKRHNKEMESLHQQMLGDKKEKTSSEKEERTSEIAATADDVGKYKIDIKQVPAKIRAAVEAKVKEKYPDWNAATYGQRNKAEISYQSGAGAKQIQSLSVVAQHLDALEQLSEGLNNKNTTIINSAKNYFSSALGHPEVTDFNTAKQAVAQEILKAIGGSGPQSRKDREEAEAALDAARSPKQIKGSINTLKHLIAARLDVVRQNYKAVTGKTDEDFNQLVSPEVQASLKSSSVKPQTSLNGWTLKEK